MSNGHSLPQVSTVAVIDPIKRGLKVFAEDGPEMAIPVAVIDPIKRGLKASSTKFLPLRRLSRPLPNVMTSDEFAKGV